MAVVHALFMIKGHFVKEMAEKDPAFTADTLGAVQEMLLEEGWAIAGLAKNLTAKDLERVYAEHRERPYYPGLLASVEQSTAYHLVVVTRGAAKAAEAVARLKEKVVGPTNPDEARRTAEGCLRALYGTNCPNNAFHASDSVEAGQREVEAVFGPSALEPFAPRP